jgi:hypothetical protein
MNSKNACLIWGHNREILPHAISSENKYPGLFWNKPLKKLWCGAVDPRVKSLFQKGRVCCLLVLNSVTSTHVFRKLEFALDRSTRCRVQGSSKPPRVYSCRSMSICSPPHPMIQHQGIDVNALMLNHWVWRGANRHWATAVHTRWFRTTLYTTPSASIECEFKLSEYMCRGYWIKYQ